MTIATYHSSSSGKNSSIRRPTSAAPDDGCGAEFERNSIGCNGDACAAATAAPARTAAEAAIAADAPPISGAIGGSGPDGYADGCADG